VIPQRVLVWSGLLGGVRLLAFFLLYLQQSTDAQWQIAYWPLWLMDFPISLFYFVLRLPIPLAEGIVGPIWWFILPIIVWSFRRKKNG
jgi:hypothetical protein